MTDRDNHQALRSKVLARCNPNSGRSIDMDKVILINILPWHRANILTWESWRRRRKHHHSNYNYSTYGIRQRKMSNYMVDEKEEKFCQVALELARISWLPKMFIARAIVAGTLTHPLPRSTSVPSCQHKPIMIPKSYGPKWSKILRGSTTVSSPVAQRGEGLSWPGHTSHVVPESS